MFTAETIHIQICSSKHFCFYLWCYNNLSEEKGEKSNDSIQWKWEWWSAFQNIWYSLFYCLSDASYVVKRVLIFTVTVLDVLLKCSFNSYPTERCVSLTKFIRDTPLDSRSYGKILFESHVCSCIGLKISFL